jgi:sec-independent protein translocase protein TatA
MKVLQSILSTVVHFADIQNKCGLQALGPSHLPEMFVIPTHLWYIVYRLESEIMPIAFIESPVALLVVLLIALLLFGHKLPNVARSLGSSVSEFKKGVRDGENELNQTAPPAAAAQPPAVNQTTLPPSATPAQPAQPAPKQ